MIPTLIFLALYPLTLWMQYKMGRRKAKLQMIDLMLKIGKRNYQNPMDELLALYIELPKLIDEEFADPLSKLMEHIYDRREAKRIVKELTK